MPMSSTTVQLLPRHQILPVTLCCDLALQHLLSSRTRLARMTEHHFRV
jgi:hypothetical protein